MTAPIPIPIPDPALTARTSARDFHSHTAAGTRGAHSRSMAGTNA